MSTKPAHLMSASERRERLETSLENAKYMLRMERDIASGKGWSQVRRDAANESIPQWQNRVTELRGLLCLKP